mmetsp:Transcript_85312/g.260839  ORF Transcript_85312/g.260839 Transcript_85312/m.260839 type:complete len:205 (-) Transcript_85312:378-992(-)
MAWLATVAPRGLVAGMVLLRAPHGAVPVLALRGGGARLRDRAGLRPAADPLHEPPGLLGQEVELVHPPHDAPELLRPVREDSRAARRRPGGFCGVRPVPRVHVACHELGGGVVRAGGDHDFLCLAIRALCGPGALEQNDSRPHVHVDAWPGQALVDNVHRLATGAPILPRIAQGRSLNRGGAHAATRIVGCVRVRRLGCTFFLP